MSINVLKTRITPVDVSATLGAITLNAPNHPTTGTTNNAVSVGAGLSSLAFSAFASQVNSDVIVRPDAAGLGYQTFNNPITFTPAAVDVDVDVITDSLSLSSSAPQIVSGGGLNAPGVNGTIEDEGVITISWDGSNSFGSGGAPNIIVASEFENGTDGVAASDSDAYAGSWSNAPGIYDNAQFRSKGFSVKCAEGGDEIGPRGVITHADTTHFFTAYAVRCSLVPVATGAWKVTWHQNTEDGFKGGNNLYDAAWPTKGSGNGWPIGGNDGNIVDGGRNPVPQANVWALMQNWARYDGDGANPIFQSRHTETGNYSALDTTVTNQGWFGDVSTSNVINHITIPGLISPRTQPASVVWETPEVWYDDIYHAIGDACAARVLIGDASTIPSCSNVAISHITARSGTSITATVKQSIHGNLSGKYIFVIDENNDVVPYNGSDSRLIS